MWRLSAKSERLQRAQERLIVADWEDIWITGRDKQRSEQPSKEDSELSLRFPMYPRRDGCRYVTAC